MTLVDNKLSVAKYRLAYIVTFVTGLGFIFFAEFSNNPIKENKFSLILGIVLLLIFFLMLLIKPEYVYFSIEKNSKLLVRNYNAFPLFRKYKAFEIPLNNIHDFEIKQELFGLKKSIRILVKSKNKVGKYPWQSLSAVPSKNINQIIDALNKLLPPDMRKKTRF